MTEDRETTLAQTWAIIRLIRVLVIGAMALGACGSPYRTAHHIQTLTIPSGETPPAFSEPTTEHQKLRFDWEFITRLTADQYLAWVERQLTDNGFTIRQRQVDALNATKLDGGDAYRLSIAVITQPSTHIRIVMTVSLD